MADKLAGYVTFHNKEDGISHTFGPDDELPDWAAEQVRPEHLEPEASVADLPAAGPGQTAGAGMTDEEKIEARRAADRDRKAAARAAAKAEKEQADQLAAAQAAEAQRQAEAAAAAAAQAASAAQQGQGQG